MKAQTASREKNASRWKTCFRRAIILAAFGLSGFLALSSAWPQQPAQPSSRDKCPVCGMFVAGYRDFLAAITFQDGSTFYFDGPKDMFRFLFDPAKYSPGRQRSDIRAVWVTDYYSVTLIDGSAAHYVRGGNVLGPMGSELIPFGKEDEAKEFMKDHKGEAILRFDDITPDVIKSLD